MALLRYRHGVLQTQSTDELNSKLVVPQTLHQTHDRQHQHKSKDTSLDNRRNFQAKEIMTYPVITAKEQDVVTKVIDILNKTNVSHIVVINAQRTPLALTSRQQLNKVTSPNNTFMLNFCDSQVLVVQEHTTVREIAHGFIKYKVAALCVINAANELSGIICRNDLLNLLVSGAINNKGNSSLWPPLALMSI